MTFPVIPQFSVNYPLSVSYIGSETGGSGTTTRTFSNASIGAAPASGFDRYIVGVMTWKDGTVAAASLSSGTIDGNSATVAGSNADVASSRAASGMMIYGPLNSGTSVDIAFTWSANPGNLHICHIYQVICRNGGGDITLTPSDTFQDDKPDPSDTASCPAGSVAIGAIQSVNGDPMTWTGLTEDDETDVDSSDISSVASRAFRQAGGTVTIQAAPTGTETEAALFGAVWSPVS